MEQNMQQTLPPSGESTVSSDLLLNVVRRQLKRHHLIPALRVLRLLLHFGPWRAIPRFLIRQLRPVARIQDDEQASLLGPLDVNAIAEEVRQNSVAVAGMLSPEAVSRLRAITDRLPVNDYQRMDQIDLDVHELSNDPTIKNVLRAYFKCEPALLECTLVITGPYETHGISQQNAFHFDYAGWESLNVFVYLSDVKAGSSCHIVAKGSHRKVGLRDVLCGSLNDADAVRRFGSHIQPITGSAGTVFFENTEAFHRRHPGNDRRVMRNLLYGSHRSWLSLGRTSRAHIEKRLREYDRLRMLD